MGSVITGGNNQSAIASFSTPALPSCSKGIRPDFPPLLSRHLLKAACFVVPGALLSPRGEKEGI